MLWSKTKILWSMIRRKPEDIILVKLLKWLTRHAIYCFVSLMILFSAIRIHVEIFDDGMLAYLYADSIWRIYEDDCIAIGNTIIIALEKYHFDNRKYPEQLEQLTPKYLSKIPKHRLGKKKWKYVSDGNSFSLLFAANRDCYPNCCYRSKIGTWLTDD
ncbi:MAG: hypothetical protein LBB88_00400 [Planctomycetaceae bacterium]|nr:hypothetical protein [Planctomycetaceae bacterium]